jgi:hypothetical protein
VGGPTLVADMQKPAIGTDWGDGSFYGFGLAIGEYRGLRMVGHGGGDPGISAYVARFPDQGFAVAVLGNLDSINTVALVRGVADIYLAKSFPVSSATNAASVPAEVSLSLEQLASKAGLYRDPTTEIIGRFFVRDGKLMASADTGEENFVELVPLDANRFVIPGTTVAVEFIPGPDGQAREVRVTGAGLKPKLSQRLAPFMASSKDLRAFAGEYKSPEIETTYAITSRDSDLLARMPAGDEVLHPVSLDTFAGSSLSIVKFWRDSRGRVKSFTVNTSGVRGLPFERSNK